MIKEFVTEAGKKFSLYEKFRGFLEEYGNDIVVVIGMCLVLINVIYGFMKSDLTNITMGFLIYLLIDQRLAHADLFSYYEDEEEDNEKED